MNRLKFKFTRLGGGMLFAACLCMGIVLGGIAPLLAEPVTNNGETPQRFPAHASPTEFKAAPPNPNINWSISPDGAVVRENVRLDNGPLARIATPTKEGGIRAGQATYSGGEMPPANSRDETPQRFPAHASPTEFKAAPPNPNINWSISPDGAVVRENVQEAPTRQW